MGLKENRGVLPVCHEHSNENGWTWCPLVWWQQGAGFDLFKVTVFIVLRLVREAGGLVGSVTSLCTKVTRNKANTDTKCCKYCPVREPCRGVEANQGNISYNGSCQKVKGKSVFRGNPKVAQAGCWAGGMHPVAQHLPGQCSTRNTGYRASPSYPLFLLAWTNLAMKSVAVWNQQMLCSGQRKSRTSSHSAQLSCNCLKSLRMLKIDVGLRNH